MTSIQQEIVTCYETLGMTIEQIAEDTGAEIAAVKAILLQCSSTYRKDAKSDDKLNFTEDEAEACKKIIMGIARHSEDEHLQFKAARYVLDVKTNRIEAGKQLNTVTFNAIYFNEQMQRALKAAQQTKDKAIEIASQKQLVDAAA